MVRPTRRHRKIELTSWNGRSDSRPSQRAGGVFLSVVERGELRSLGARQLEEAKFRHALQSAPYRL